MMPLTKGQMEEALREAKIDFEHTMNVSQIRRLYDSHVRQSVVETIFKPSSNDENLGSASNAPENPNNALGSPNNALGNLGNTTSDVLGSLGDTLGYPDETLGYPGDNPDKSPSDSLGSLDVNLGNTSDPPCGSSSRVPNPLAVCASMPGGAPRVNQHNLNNAQPVIRVPLEIAAPLVELDDAALNAELARLEKLHRIATLREELAGLNFRENNLVPTRRDEISFADVQCAIAPFTGDDNYRITKWIEDFERLMESLNSSQNHRLLCARRLLGGSAAILMRSAAVNSWNALKEQLIIEFDRQVDRREIYRKMAARTILTNESVRQYVLEMQNLGSQVNIGEDELILFIIDGLQDRSPAMSVLIGVHTMAEFKKRLPEYQRFRSQFNTPAPRTLSTVRTNNLPSGVANQRPTQPSSSVNPEPARCFNCREFGHIQIACPQPKRPPGACFTCHSTEHVYRDCPNRRAMRQMAGPVFNDQQPIPEDQRDLDGELSEIQLVSVYNNSSSECTHFKTICSLFDTGSPINFVRRSALPTKLPSDVLKPSVFKGLGNGRVLTYGKVKLKIGFESVNKIIDFLVVPDEILPTPLLLGRDFLMNFGIGLKRLSTKNILNKRIKNSWFEKVCVSDYFSKPDKCVSSSVCTDGHLIVPDIFNIQTELSGYEIDVGVDFGEDFKNNCLKLVEYLNSSTVLENTPLVQHNMQIRLSSDVPIYCNPRRLSFHERNQVDKITQDLLSKGIIRHSNSPYASPIVLVRKKSGDLRLCVDYRAINKLTIRDNYPVPLIDDCIEYLDGKKCFSLLDLKSGFHQVFMEEKSIPYTSFVTPQGQFEFLKMPFGLKNGPSVFQRFITNVFDDLLRKNEIVVYMDDILVATTTPTEHLVILKKVFDRLRQYNLEINLQKCHLLKKSIDFLGYRADKNGIRPNGTHCSTIKDYPIPKNLRELQSCLGLFSYFRRFVPSFSRIALPLLNLVRSKPDKPFIFDNNCEKAFIELKNALASSPVLAIYNPNRYTELHTDASSHGFGAVLLQRQDDGKMHPVAYYSRRTTEAEEKYHSFELETLAIIYALRRFRVYLEGIKFLIITDCNSLTQTLSKKSLNPRIARWALELENYQYSIIHRQGTSMGHVDALSRNLPVGFVYADDLDVQIQATQSRDQTIVKLRAFLEEKEDDNFELRDGLVYRKMKAGHLSLYVPSELENNIIRLIHEKIGHLGIDKCYQQIRMHYWFSKMYDKIQTYISNCITCIMHTPPRHINERQLHSIPKIPVPFDTIHIDHFGPLTHTLNKNKHILVIIDAFTKFVKLYPVNTTSTKEVCAALQKYFDYYSRPRRIIADRGTCFTSQEFENFNAERNIQHIKNAVASPQANGQVERVNRTMGRMLGKLSNPINQADWSRLLSKVEYAINNSVHSTTGTTPSKLLFGVDQRGNEIDKLTEILDSRQEPCPRDLEALREKANILIKQSQSRNEAQYVKRSFLPHKYKVGDFIVIRNVDTTIGTSKKLIPKYRGPYVVHKILEHDRYVVKDIENCQLTQIPYNAVLEAARMRPWVQAREGIVSACFGFEDNEIVNTDRGRSDCQIGRVVD